MSGMIAESYSGNSKPFAPPTDRTPHANTHTDVSKVTPKVVALGLKECTNKSIEESLRKASQELTRAEKHGGPEPKTPMAPVRRETGPAFGVRLGRTQDSDGLGPESAPALPRGVAEVEQGCMSAMSPEHPSAQARWPSALNPFSSGWASLASERQDTEPYVEGGVVTARSLLTDSKGTWVDGLHVTTVDGDDRVLGGLVLDEQRLNGEHHSFIYDVAVREVVHVREITGGRVRFPATWRENRTLQLEKLKYHDDLLDFMRRQQNAVPPSTVVLWPRPATGQRHDAQPLPLPQPIVGTLSVREATTEAPAMIEVTDAAGQVHIVDLETLQQGKATLFLVEPAVLGTIPPPAAPLHVHAKELQGLWAAVKEASAGNDFFDSAELWNWFSANPSEVDRILDDWYPKQSFDGVRERLGREHLALMVDPGIACRHNGFVDWLERYRGRNGNASLHQIRTDYATFLETQRGREDTGEPANIYRGLFLTPEQAEELQRKGLLPPAMRQEGGAEDFLYHHLKSGRPREAAVDHGIASQIQARRMDCANGLRDGLASTSAYVEATYAPSQTFSQGRPFYLFKLDVPAIRLIQLRGALEGVGSNADYHGAWYVAPAVDGGEKWISWTDSLLEIFTLGPVAPEQIVEVTRYESKPDWRTERR